MSIFIEHADLVSEEFAALVTAHTLFCDALSPPESCHRLPIAELASNNITVWQASSDQQVVGMGALKELSPTDGEVKSMHTLEETRGLGIGRRILEVIMDEAKSRNYSALWLETGSHSDFASARKMYAACGFVETEPFGEYELDPHSVFMTLKLEDREET
ncbi:MAG: GNAT family N-acetyltransferase [Rhizobiaceae bacterium]|nr:GNAT family N-acetyltransferase [Rhizobiaceae bacterium]